MNARLVGDACEKLISSDISVLLWHTEVIPGRVFGLEDVAGLHIGILQAHGRQMIAEQHEDRFLIAFGEHVGQVSDEFIYFMNLVYIIFPLIVGFLCVSTGNGDLRIRNDLFSRVVAMSLYGDRIDEICLIRGGIHGLFGFVDQDIVGRPVTERCVFLNVHHFLTGKSIKAHHGKSVGATVKVTAVVVYNVCAVADGRKIGCDAFAVSLF